LSKIRVSEDYPHSGLEERGLKETTVHFNDFLHNAVESANVIKV